MKILMARFRRADRQAEYIVNSVSALSKARHSSDIKAIHSLGSKRNYQSSLKLANEWLVANGNRNGLDKMTPKLCKTYLNERAVHVSQKTLDQDRQSLNFLPLVKSSLPVIKSEMAHGKLGQQSRAYSIEQLSIIQSFQSPSHALATEIATDCGLRAHEFYTIRPVNEQPASPHRVWSKNRFSGQEGMIYTVIGKGGLIREILLSNSLAQKLESNRRPEPIQITDRKIFYQSYYEIAGGQNWSQSFSQASSKLFGWSHGAHGTRHTFAQTRMKHLQQIGFNYKSALSVVSQEMGHFRPQITEVYLR